jgi:uncharacterized protein YbjQ (UPF0145 family)
MSIDDGYPPSGVEPPPGDEPPPDRAPPADLPAHARERLQRTRADHLFTSDLSVNEFLLIKEVGFEPIGLVMGSSIYQIRPSVTDPEHSGELASLTEALYAARGNAMTRLEEEAEALAADGVVGVRLALNLHPWGEHVAEFVAIGTAVRHGQGAPFRNRRGRPFTSNLSGQDFWTLLRSGFRPVGFVLGNCVYYVAPEELGFRVTNRNQELLEYTHALYDARERATLRLQVEAEELEAAGVVGVTFEEQQHTWQSRVATKGRRSSSGRMIELLMMGTAVVAGDQDRPVPVPALVIDANR